MGPYVASGSAIKTDPEPLLGSSICTLLLLFHTRKAPQKAVKCWIKEAV